MRENPTSMRAVVLDAPAPPEALQLRDVPVPAPEMLQTSHGSLTVGLDARPGQSILIRGGTSSVGSALESEEAHQAQQFDGVRPDTIKIFVAG